jgi:hypothetical protein
LMMVILKRCCRALPYLWVAGAIGGPMGVISTVDLSPSYICSMTDILRTVKRATLYWQK